MTAAPPPDDVRRASVLELLLVLGLPVLAFAGGAVRSASRADGMTFTDARLLGTLLLEAVIAALALPYLRRRGWTPAAVGAPEPLDVVRGAVVWAGSGLVVLLAYGAAYAAAPAWLAAVAATEVSGTVTAPVVVAASVLNPVFEEFLWLGYGVPALASRVGLRAACLTSAALRLAVHLYQGPVTFVTILPLALFYTWYYARSRRLWPLVVAHVLSDAIALATLAGHPR